MSDNGIIGVVLPKESKEAVEREMMNAEIVSAECGVWSAEYAEKKESSAPTGEKHLNKAVVLLKKYFSGKRVAFDLPLDISYYTVFQQSVWRACMQIPAGETRSYGWLARKIKNPGAARAVGQAMGANPIPVIIP